MARITLKARLRGPDSLVWDQIEPQRGPRWLPGYGEFEGDADTPDAQMVLRSYHNREPIIRERGGKVTHWYVDWLEVIIGES